MSISVLADDCVRCISNAGFGLGGKHSMVPLIGPRMKLIDMIHTYIPHWRPWLVVLAQQCPWGMNTLFANRTAAGVGCYLGLYCAGSASVGVPLIWRGLWKGELRSIVCC